MELKQAGRRHFTTDRIMAAISAYMVIMLTLAVWPKEGFLAPAMALLSLICILLFVKKQVTILQDPKQNKEISDKIAAVCAKTSLRSVIESRNLSLIIRTSYDNAGTVLSAISILEAGLRSFMNNFEEIAAWFPIIFALLSSVFLLYQGIFQAETQTVFAGALFVCKWAITGALVPVAFGPISFLFRKVFLTAYGLQFKDNSFDVEVCINSTPDTEFGYKVKTILPSLSRKLNRHSIYENREAIQTIIEHIKDGLLRTL